MRTARFSQLAMSQSREYVRIYAGATVGEFSLPKMPAEISRPAASHTIEGGLGTM